MKAPNGGQVSIVAFARPAKGRSQYNTPEGLLANPHLKWGLLTLNERITNEANAIHETTNQLQSDLNTETADRKTADNELNERITNEANAIHETTNQLQNDLTTETTAREAGDKALDERITNVKEYVLSETVSKADAAVQDGAIVKAANTIGDNVTKLDAALAKETAARIGADKAQDKVIEQVNQNMVDGFNTINKNMADGFTALNQADAALDDKITAETAGRVAADTKLVKAMNSGLSLSEDNVLQKDTTTIDAQGNVTPSKTDANEMILNKDNDNRITMNENGIKVGKNSTVMDKDGVYTGGDTYSEAKAAMSVDGSIRGANGKFTVNSANGTVSVNDQIELNGATGVVKSNGLNVGDGNFTVNSNGGVKAADGKITLSSDGSVKAADGKFTVDTNGAVKAANGNTTIDSNGNLKTMGTLSAADGSFKVDSNGKIISTGLNAGNGTIQTTGTVQAGDVKTGTLETTGDATIGGNLTVDKNLKVNGEFNAKTLSSKLDENNYTTINGGKTQSVNLKVDTKTRETQASASTFDETGSNAWAKDDDSIGTSSMTADKISQSLSDTGDHPKNIASRELSQNTDNKYEIMDSVVDEDGNTNTSTQTASESSSVVSGKDGKNTYKSYITQNLKQILQKIEDGDGNPLTSVAQTAKDITNTAKNGTITNDAGKLVNTASDTIANTAGNDITNTSTNGNIANTAANGTISNNAKNLTNTASENITNKAENGNISNIASNGTISNEAKTISNKADEALTNDAKTITNTASESVTTQIGNGSEVQSVMNGDGIANKATGKSITNDAATITNTGTTSVTNQVGKNKVLVDTTHVQSAFGDTIYTTWAESGITNNATDKTVATNAKDILNTASDSITDKVGENVERTMGTKKIEESVKDAEGNSNTFTKTADKDINTVTDGTNTSTESQLAGSVNTSLKVVDAEGKTTQSLSNVKTVSDDTTKITDTTKNAFSSSSQKADSITNTVKDMKTGTISERSQTVSQVQDKVGTTTVTTTDGLTKLTNEAGTHNTQMDFAEVLRDLGVRGNAVVDGTSTLKGDVTMESNASVGKNLTVNGDTTMKGNASVGKDLTVAGTSTLTGDVTMKSNATVEKDLTVNGKSTLTGDVTMGSNATVEKDLTVKGKTTTETLVVNNGATIAGGATVTGGTTTDTLKVTGSSDFGGAATFNDIVKMNKGLSVTGGVTADSYKVGDKTYIDKDGINANNQVIRNVGQGDISEGSHDAVSGGQLYETNTRVSGLETRMGTVETKVDKLDNKIDKVGANAAAMANLHPLEFDEDSKWNIAAAVGSSGSETASAVGVFYRPNENVMVNASAAMGTGENMFGGGVSLRLGHGGNKAKDAQMKAAAKENRELRAKVDDLTARMDALLSVLNPNMSKDFPDVPENHWAYEAVSRLAGNGIVEGYEDGKYHGERQMTRYEMAEIIYNALSKGAKAEKKLVEEFRPELQAMAAQKKA